jgi:hypothetical protein
MNIFTETKVSFFKPYKNRDGEWTPGRIPELKPLFEVLTTDWQPRLTAAIKREPDKSRRDSLKKRLYGITPSAVMKGGRKGSASMVHTGLIQFDIDTIPESEIQSYIAVIRLIPHVLYLSISASGRGLWGLMQITDPEKHSLHYDAIKASFNEIGIKIDTAPRAVNSLRFLSYDPQAYFNPDAPVFDEIIEPVKPKPYKSKLKSRLKVQGDFNNPNKWFNSNCTAEYITEILENFDFAFHSINGPRHRFTRPGKDVSAGLSVDFHEEKRILYSFSSSVQGLEYWKQEKENGWSCSPLTALLIYGCGGFKQKHWAIAHRYIKDKMEYSLMI